MVNGKSEILEREKTIKTREYPLSLDNQPIVFKSSQPKSDPDHGNNPLLTERPTGKFIWEEASAFAGSGYRLLLGMQWLQNLKSTIKSS